MNEDISKFSESVQKVTTRLYNDNSSAMKIIRNVRKQLVSRLVFEFVSCYLHCSELVKGQVGLSDTTRLVY